jgi:signal transduction histidine kinase
LKEFQKNNFELDISKNEFIQDDSTEFFRSLSYSLSEIPGIENFQCLGDLSTLIEEQEYNFEVHCRINADKEIEFLFNDVGRTKLREMQLAEFKYKSLFLSKVAHEFKNPLICITELLNRSFEMLPSNVKKNNDLMLNLEQIKSVSNFLQILIKDLNYFSESQFGRRTEYEENETDLSSVIEFCSKIGQTLLSKSNKSEKVEYKVNIDERLPEKIITDEWRLKQILVNLISNAVKFTLFGSITLDVSLVDDEQNSENCPKEQFVEKSAKPRIKFLVKDTGIGIKEYKQKNIFKPFQKDSTSNIKIYNEFGAGLGLSIANEIASKIGLGLEFHSKQGEGTSFWFYMPLPSDYNRQERIKNNNQVLPAFKRGSDSNNKHLSLKITSTCNVSEESKIIRDLQGIPQSNSNSQSCQSIIDSSISDDSHLEFDTENSKLQKKSSRNDSNGSIFSKVKKKLK